jgi:nucleotide-binding universal stress UspA family protein
MRNRPQRLLLCVDDKSTVRDLVAYAARVATGRLPVVRVVHVLDCTSPAGLNAEKLKAAHDLVDETVFELQMAGIGGEGAVRQCGKRKAPAALAEEAQVFRADSIVVGAPPRKRLFGGRVRERVVCRAGTTVVIAPSVHHGNHPALGGEDQGAASDTRSWGAKGPRAEA